MIVFPLTAIVGQEQLIEALLINVVAPDVGGLLVRGERGTAKTTAVRGLASLLAPAPLVELPLGTTLDRLVGSLDLREALAGGEHRFEPGMLHRANGGILYVDEVNLLADHLVDALLDAAATGVARVEREAVSVTHEARFMLVGTMNIEEGDLRPQLLDRFGLGVEVKTPRIRQPGPRSCDAGCASSPIRRHSRPNGRRQRRSWPSAWPRRGLGSTVSSSRNAS